MLETLILLQQSLLLFVILWKLFWIQYDFAEKNSQLNDILFIMLRVIEKTVTIWIMDKNTCREISEL